MQNIFYVIGFLLLAFCTTKLLYSNFLKSYRYRNWESTDDGLRLKSQTRYLLDQIAFQDVAFQLRAINSH